MPPGPVRPRIAEQVEDIAGWSAIRTDPFTLVDRLRNLRLAPWRDTPGTAPGSAWRPSGRRSRDSTGCGATPDAADGPGDLVVCGGGAFAAVPPAAAALAVVDGMRAPGAVAACSTTTPGSWGLSGRCPMPVIAGDCWSDLLDDALLPIGSTIVIGEGRVAGRAPIAMRLTSDSPQQDVELPSGDVRVLDLPPGVPARVELASRETGLLGLRSRRVAVEVTGGLGGLLVDTRDVPLRLPDRVERRRAQLEAWEHAVWSADRMSERVGARPLGRVTPGEPWRLVVPAGRPVVGPEVRLRLEPGDRALVAAGEEVRAGQDVLEHPRERVAAARAAPAARPPGPAHGRARLGARPGAAGHAPIRDRRGPFPGPTRRPGVPAVRRARSRRARGGGALARAGRLARGRRGRGTWAPTACSSGASGLGLTGPVGWGQPVVGRAVMGVTGPDEELRASAIDISAAGAVLVAGARLDIEAVTRARAIGVAGILCGGAVGRELRQLEESDERQRASLHATTPFAILALDGFGRRPMPIIAWDLLVAAAAEGSRVAVVPEAGLAVVPTPPEDRIPHWTPDAVRITAGEGAGTTGRLVGLAGPVRRPGGSYQSAGHVGLRPPRPRRSAVW